MRSFGEWFLLKEGSKKRASQPVQMPEVQTNKIKIRKPKDRLPGGRRDTSFSDEANKRTRGSVNRKAIEDSGF